MSTIKESAQKNAIEVARVLKGTAITQLGKRGAEALEKHLPGGFEGAAAGEPSGFLARAAEEKLQKRARGTEDAELVDAPAKLLPGEKVALDKPAKSSFAEQVRAAMGQPDTEELEAKAKAGTVAFLASMPPPLERAELSVAMLEESPTNPRKTFAGLEELADSMRKLGCLQPIIVRPLPAGGYQVVAGHRRVRAAKLAKLDTLPAEVRPLTDAQVMEVQLAENLQRSDLSPLEEAEGYEWLHREIGMTVDQIAQKLGRTKATIYGRMKLLDLSPTCRKALAEGKIPMSVAAPLARCGRHVDQEKALKAIRARAENNGGEINARAEVEWLQKEYTRSMKSPPFDVRDEMLLEGTPACTKCPKRTANMPRELFDTKPADTCTDVPCFLAKSRAHFEAAAKAASDKQGARVMSIEEGAALFRFDTLGPDSNLVELDTPNTADTKRRPWRELLEKLPEEKRPQLVVAPDRNLAPRLLVDRKEITKALADETGMKWAVEATAKAPRKSKEEVEAAREEKRETKARAAAALIAAQKIAAAAAKGPTPGEWAVIFEAVSGASSFRPEVFEALQVKSFAELDKRMRKAAVGEVITATLTLALVESGHLEAEDGFTDELKALAKGRGVDLAAIEKACAVVTPADEKPAAKAKRGRK